MMLKSAALHPSDHKVFLAAKIVASARWRRYHGLYSSRSPEDSGLKHSTEDDPNLRLICSTLIATERGITGR